MEIKLKKILIFGATSRIAVNFIKTFQNNSVELHCFSSSKNRFNEIFLKKNKFQNYYFYDFKYDLKKLDNIKKLFKKTDKLSFIFLNRNQTNLKLDKIMNWSNEYYDNVIFPYFTIKKFKELNFKIDRIITFSSIYSKNLPPSNLNKIQNFPIQYSCSKAALNTLNKFLTVKYKDVKFFNLILGGVSNKNNRKFEKKYAIHTLSNKMIKTDNLNFLISSIIDGKLDDLRGNDLEFNAGFGVIK